MGSVPNPKSPYYKLIQEREEKVPKDKRLPMPFVEYVDPVILLKGAGLEPAKDGKYAQGYTQIAPPTRIKPGLISLEDSGFFRDYLSFDPGKTTMKTLLGVWYLLEDNAQKNAQSMYILEKYGMFTHAFGRKPG